MVEQKPSKLTTRVRGGDVWDTSPEDARRAVLSRQAKDGRIAMKRAGHNPFARGA